MQPVPNIVLSNFIYHLLKEEEEAGLGVQLCNNKTITGMLFADNFVGVSDSREKLQKLISKSAVMVFAERSEVGVGRA